MELDLADGFHNHGDGDGDGEVCVWLWRRLSVYIQREVSLCAALSLELSNKMSSLKKMTNFTLYLALYLSWCILSLWSIFTKKKIERQFSLDIFPSNNSYTIVTSSAGFLKESCRVIDPAMENYKDETIHKMLCYWLKLERSGNFVHSPCMVERPLLHWRFGAISQTTCGHCGHRLQCRLVSIHIFVAFGCDLTLFASS
jgi:hypothetical protein